MVLTTVSAIMSRYMLSTIQEEYYMLYKRTLNILYWEAHYTLTQENILKQNVRHYLSIWHFTTPSLCSLSLLEGERALRV